LRIKILLSIAGTALLVGCYTLQPTSTAPQPGNEIALDINDVGRVGLGGPMGPSIRQVEGRLVSKNDSDYVLAVTDVHLLDGGDQVWHGESVHVKSDYVSSVYERKFSMARSVALGAAGVGVVAAIATTSLVGLGSTDRGTTTPGDTSQSTRIPRPVRAPVHKP
jgi:hypothetical protein